MPMQFRWAQSSGVRWVSGCLVAVLVGACASEGALVESGDDAAAVSGGEPGRWDLGSPTSLLRSPPPMAADEGALDADGDGLSTAYERAHGSDPQQSDSDRDGASDLAESVAGTDPSSAASLPAARGDFYFVSPYDEEPKPARQTLLFSTALRSADLFILVDTTGSMQPVLRVLQQKLSSVIVPSATALIADLRVGVGAFQDFAVAPYGDPGDRVFAITQPPTRDIELAQAGVNALRLGSGGDGPEGGIPALYALATGQGFGPYLPSAAPCADRGVGYACLRPDAVPIVLLISDAQFHNGPRGDNLYTITSPALPNYQATLAALRAIHARVIGIHAGTGLPLAASEVDALAVAVPVTGDAVEAELQALSRDTGAVTAAGAPLVFGVDAAASGLDARVVDAVRAVAEQVPLEVSAVLRDDPSDAVDATQLIERIEVHAGGAASYGGKTCSDGLAARDGNRDGALDTFTNVRPGTPVCFDVIAKKNRSVPSGAKPVVYKAFIDVVADGSTRLDTRSVYLLVPPATPVLL